MAKKPLFLNTHAPESFWEEIEYTPPKHAVDIGHFNDFLTAGSYSLPDLQILGGERDYNLSASPKEFFMSDDGPPLDDRVKMCFAKSEPMDPERLSTVDSMKAGAQTATTASP